MAPKRPSQSESAPAQPPAPADPRLLDLGSAVGEIQQACEELGGTVHRAPFFLIVGAGISYPPVPLAGAIIEHCQGVARRYRRVKPPPSRQALDLYSHWFSRAYPGARQRQRYLRSLIEKKPLSLATLRLGHLLAAHKLTNIVVTTNFDDFIARALRLFGDEPVVCDHPRTVGRIDPDRDDVQIIHVHGSYLFYDCANLRGEVAGRARPDARTSLTMVGLLDRLLWSRSPVVVGYSGWEGDVIMSALKRRLSGGNSLGQSVYWFCYRRADLDSLPDWLRQESADIRFVIPSEPSAEPTPPGRLAGAEPRPEPTLPSVEVFDQLNRAFDIGSPPLFENPIACFAKNLENALPETEGVAGDPYAFKALVDRLHRAAGAFAKIKTPRGVPANLDRLRSLMRASQYSRAVALLARIMPARLAKLDAAARQEILAAANLAGSAVFAKQAEGKLVENLANVLVFDPDTDRALGELPKGTAWCFGSRSGQYGYETVVDGKSHGAFTYHLVDALRDPAADRDKDGRISLLDATVEAGRRVLRGASPQTPVVAGDAAGIALYAARGRASRKRGSGTLNALLVGAGKHRDTSIVSLSGPANDLARLAKLLGSRDRRLFQRAAVQRLLDGEATRAQVLRALSGIAGSARAQDLLLFYFSGHAFRRDAGEEAEGRQEIVLAFYDYDGKGGGEATHRDLLDALAPAKPGQKIVILDF